MRRCIISIIILTSAWSVSASAATFLVPSQYPTIQAGIDAAVNGDKVVLSSGIYIGPGNRDIDFKGKAVTVQSVNPYDLPVVASTIVDCEGQGRGFYFHSGEEANSVIAGLTITNGYASNGGAVYCTSSSPTITHCIITGNTAVSINCDGGGIYLANSNSTIKRCIITNNSMIGSNRWGGGIFCYEAKPTISHCIISGNHAGKGGGIFSWSRHLNIANCILWGNNSTYGLSEIDCYNDSYLPTVVYSNVQGGWPGSGNINADPCFVDSAAGNYHLLSNSPCIDAGDPAYKFILDDLDVDGDPLLSQGRIDIGVDEFCAETNYVKPIVTTISFYAFVDSNNPEPQIVYLLKNIKGNFLWEISENCPWLDVNPRNGEISSFSDEIVFNVNISGLSIGKYNYELTITAYGAVNSPVTLNVILHILNKGQYCVPLDFQTIQDAIDWATEGDEVIVLPGVYTGLGNKNLDFCGKAITVRSLDPNDPNITDSTVIDCEGLGRGFYFHNSEDFNSVLSGVTITNGYATLGGGIFCENSGPTIRSCNITSNAVSGNESGGGGICLKVSNAKIVNCKIINNSISGTNTKGGGIYCTGCRPAIQNCVIAKNKQPVWGGGIYGTPFISHCTIADNSASYGGGGIDAGVAGNVVIQNSIIWNNIAKWDPEIDAYFHDDPKVSFSNVRGGRPGLGNIDVAPYFVDPERGDYHLLCTSPCINAGDPNYISERNETDLDGNTRIIDGRIDMGAYEFLDTTPPEFNLSVSPTVFWPPNNEMVKITPTYDVNDLCDPSPQVSLVDITANEPVNPADIQISDDGSIYLCATRSGNSEDRIYTLVYQTCDSTGNCTVKTATVTVPHDNRK